MDEFFEKAIAIALIIFILMFTIMMGIICYQSFYPEKYNIKTNNIEIKNEKI